MRSFEQRKKDSTANTNFFSPKIQTKLKTGTVGDKYEVEADNVANKVVNQNNSGALLQSKAEEEVQKKPISETISTVQKQEMKEEKPVQKKEEEKEPVQKKKEEKENAVQKKEEEKTQQKEEEPVQKKEEEENVQKKEEKKSDVESNIRKSKGNGSPMRKAIKLEMENSFGADFSSIRIHTDTNAINLCQEMGAQAFTSGSDIYFNKGKYNPNSNHGKQLLAHELTHTIQQGAASKTRDKGGL